MYSKLFDNLKPATFNYKNPSEINVSEKIYFGIMAQDIQEGLKLEGKNPNDYSILSEKYGYLAVDYIQLIPILISKVKELELEIKILKEQGK